MKPKSETSSKRPLRILMGSLVVLVVTFALLVQAAYRSEATGTELPLNRLQRLAAVGQVAEARFLDQEARVVGRYCPTGPLSLSPTGTRDPATCGGLVESFQTSYPSSDASTSALIQSLGNVTTTDPATGAVTTMPGAAVSVDAQTNKQVMRLLVTVVMPLLILANLFALIFMPKGGDSSMAEVVGFGRFNRRRQREKAAENAVTFADVAGAGHAVTELAEVIDYLKNPGRFEALGASAPRGVLLFGPPGTGKTLLARAVAGESGVPFVSVSGTEFVESLVGVGAARVRDLFSQVRDLAPAICFVDEIDALGRKREGEGSSGGEREQTLNQLLVEMDGFDAASGLVVIAATNRPDILDPALMRPGRFDRHITLEPPDLAGRRDILAVHARKRPMAADVDLDHVATRTPGFTGADLASVLNEAALLTVRQGVAESGIGAAQISEAIQRVLHGPHRGTILTPEERRRIAVHEAGHALVAAALGHGSEVHRVSLVARGRTAGTTAVGSGDRVLHTAEELTDRLTMAVAGVAAEVATLGSISTTAEDDVARASAVARQMVGLYGMSERIGRMGVLTRQAGYLGEDGVALDTVGSATVATFDAEVGRLIAAAEARAKEILAANAAVLEAMVERLQTEETLEGDELVRALAPVAPAPKAETNGHAHTPTAATARPTP